MPEEKMLDAVQSALRDRGIEDELIAAGQFNPRGHSGGMFLGGVAGDEAGSLAGDVGEGVGAAAGTLAGMHAADAARGLPPYMQIGVSDQAVYGFAGRSRSKEPDELVFQVPRAGLTAKVHERANVRVLELGDEGSGSRIELEGNRLPLTHSKDVIEALTR
jgi:hypothetical protein